jgi:hypothetical protein
MFGLVAVELAMLLIVSVKLLSDQPLIVNSALPARSGLVAVYNQSTAKDVLPSTKIVAAAAGLALASTAARTAANANLLEFLIRVVVPPDDPTLTYKTCNSAKQLHCPGAIG